MTKVGEAAKRKAAVALVASLTDPSAGRLVRGGPADHAVRYNQIDTGPAFRIFRSGASLWEVYELTADEWDAAQLAELKRAEAVESGRLAEAEALVSERQAALAKVRGKKTEKEQKKTRLGRQ